MTCEEPARQRFRLGRLMAAASLAICAPAAAREPSRPAPLTIASQGSFEAGGRVQGEGVDALSCDHGHVEYQIPAHPRAVPMFLWHSSSAAVWQRRWDGGEGFQSLLLRRGYPTYVWDGPRVGRANYGCADYTYRAIPGRDRQNFLAWRFGTEYKHWFPGLQFPTRSEEAWEQATRARYDEFDTVENAQLESDAAAKALDRIGPAVLLTNSAGGFRAFLTALKTRNVAGIVAYETPGFVFPIGEGPQTAPGIFGPVYVSQAEFAKLTTIPIQLVWGDNVDKFAGWSASYRLSQQFVDVVNAHGGHAEILRLPDRGLRGNSHIPFADLNNAAVAGLLDEFLHRNGLDRRGPARPHR